MKTVFLTVARVLYDKGYSELVAAAKIIQKKYPHVEFHWVGGIDEGYPEFVPANQVIADQDAGYIKYLGYKRNVKYFIQHADCIILPSYHEGMSRTLMETLAMGKPIITTDIAGCRETVEENKNGFLCKPRDVASLVKAIEKFLKLSEEQTKKMGNLSRLKAEQQFDVQNVIKVYENILSDYFNKK